MQVVINIDDKIYKAILDGWWPNNFVSIRQLIANGTPLPKGHGRLIDADKLVPDCREDFVYYDYDEHIEFTAVGIAQIERADTVIEADKEGEEG